MNGQELFLWVKNTVLIINFPAVKCVVLYPAYKKRGNPTYWWITPEKVVFLIEFVFAIAVRGKLEPTDGNSVCFRFYGDLKPELLFIQTVLLLQGRTAAIGAYAGLAII